MTRSKFIEYVAQAQLPIKDFFDHSGCSWKVNMRTLLTF